MVFNSHATAQDIVSEVLKICGATVNTYPLVDITRRVNMALDRFYTLAFESDGRWAFDDFGNAAPALETQNLVSGTEKYSLDAFTSEIINVLRIEILDSAGNKVLLLPFNDNEIGNQALTAFMSTSGQPTYYRKFGDWIYLYPKPNYNSTGGLSLYFERPATRMASTDTTKVPGTPTIFHPYLCRYASLPFLIEKNLPQAADIASMIAIDEDSITTYFSRRDKDVPTKIRTTHRDSR